jgi:hypothetical protein
MRQALMIAGFVLLAASSRLPAQMVAGKTAYITVGEQYLLASANAERVQRGLGPLRWDAALYQAADLHARAMAARASISHQYAGEPELSERARQAGAHFSVIAENVAEAPTAVRIQDAWMASEGHRANLLDPRLNAIGIRVLRRDGQLYAVEDFARSVENLPLEQQERTVQDAVMNLAPLTLLPTSEDARRTCALNSGYSGTRMPGFVMRYTTADLTSLPDSLRSELSDGRYHQAEIAACEGREDTKFSSYRVAVLLYP